MDLKALLTISVADKVFANPKRILLLQQIQACGSISQGAKFAGMSYKTAWDSVKDMNTRLPEPVVHSEKGGKGGGGAKLTVFGERLLQMYALTEQMQDMVLEALQDQAIPMNSLLDVMGHLSLQTSARNQLSGTIMSLEHGRNERGMAADNLNTDIQVVLANGLILHATVTQSSCTRLSLAVGKPILLLFKAPAVSIAIDKTADESNNQVLGVVHEIHSNSQTTEVGLAIIDEQVMAENIAPQMIYASIDTLLANQLKLVVGGEYYAVFSSSQTIVACMN
ncbi:MAG: molybdenum-dependent transcriptional regulator [Moritella sp.]|uniref:TOBE domain-containing protein n=1 Tax=Moritella sp. TaxID=78556 RepID=UPI000C10C4C3|nr:TOBE domain-containing protein [Moritella sp.]MBL1417072.1 TOBE domain-containing protein [Moritella sp.]PHR86626.1 MAG: molybdenum-dependent transcriptional regulator [Moritella sp.]